MEKSEIDESVLNPPSQYTHICNNFNKRGFEPNLLVDGQTKLYVTHPYDFIVRGNMSINAYVKNFGQYRGFGNQVHEESKDSLSDFIIALSQAIQFCIEFENELQPIREQTSKRISEIQ